MTATPERLDALRGRIDRVSVEPDAIDLPVTRFARPFLRLFGSFKNLSSKTDAMRALLDGIPAEPKKASELEAVLPPLLDAALLELEADVTRAEKAIVVHGALPSGHATWLTRRLRALARVAVALQPKSGGAAALVRGIRPVDVAPPLALRKDEAGAPAEPDDAARAAEASRLVALQIAAIDHVAEAARAETSQLARRRRLFEAARRLLLDAASTLPLEGEGVDVRARSIAEEIVAIDRLEAAGVDPRVGLVHQARSALADGDRRRLHAALVAMEGVAVRSGDAKIAGPAGRALRRLWRKGGRHDPQALRSSEAASADESFGGDVTQAIRSSAQSARAAAQAVLDGDEPKRETDLARLVLDYVTPGAAGETMRAMLMADGLFDVGGTLSPVRVVEAEAVARVVRHPTPDMVIVRATDPLDVVSAVIEDPRLVWLSLAAGRLLTRKFVAEETRRRSRIERRGEVRVYLVDGSGSMLRGDAARARTRDALLLCELATLLRRLEQHGARTRVVLHYGYFTQKLGELRRVSNADEALAAIGDVVATPRQGGTDIQAALLESFAIVRRAREADEALAHAQIVLVTDGESPVDEAAVDEARRAVGDVPVGLSVIALGEENEVLRNLVARQRAGGERAFYHHVPDATLRDMVAGEGTSWLGALHTPSMHDARLAPTDLARKALEDSLQELADLDEARHREAIGGLAEGEEVGEGELGRRESARGERRGLDRRFARWFSDGKDEPGQQLMRPSEDASDVDAVRMVLGTVAEVVSELGGRDDARLVDAIDLAERLLREARIAPSRYAEIVAAYPQEIEAERASVRKAARPWS